MKIKGNSLIEVLISFSIILMIFFILIETAQNRNSKTDSYDRFKGLNNMEIYLNEKTLSEGTYRYIDGDFRYDIIFSTNKKCSKLIDYHGFVYKNDKLIAETYRIYSYDKE